MENAERHKTHFLLFHHKFASIKRKTLPFLFVFLGPDPHRKTITKHSFCPTQPSALSPQCSVLSALKIVSIYFESSHLAQRRTLAVAGRSVRHTTTEDSLAQAYRISRMFCHQANARQRQCTGKCFIQSFTVCYSKQ